MIYILFKIFLSLLLYYASFVSIYMSFIKNKQYDLLTVFFVLTLCLFSAFSFYRVYGFIKSNLSKSFMSIKSIQTMKLFIKKNFQNNQIALVILTLSLISFFIGFFNIYTQYSRGLENPELAQYFSSLSNNIVDGSKKQQQPPLDYYFTAFSQSVFGDSKFAVRFHAMSFYLILSFILPLGLYFFCSSIWITIIGSLLFLFNHVIRLHSVDARPLNLALLTGFLFLFFYLSYCKSNSNCEIKKDSIFPILASQYLFVVSIGLQPVIFIVSLFLSSFSLLLVNKKTIFKRLFITNIITAILTAPFYFNMFLFGKSAYKFKKVSL